MPSALVIIADGSEEMEAVISIDILRRGGIEVTVAGLKSDEIVNCSRKVMIKPDTSLEKVAGVDFDVVVLPGGGPGAQSFAASAAVGTLLTKQENQGALIAAICAAPIALVSHGIAKGKTVTSHPAVEKKMTEGGYKYSKDRVVIDGKTLTSRGPGTAVEFALAIVEQLQGKAEKDRLIDPMLIK